MNMSILTWAPSSWQRHCLDFTVMPHLGWNLSKNEWKFWKESNFKFILVQRPCIYIMFCFDVFSVWRHTHLWKRWSHFQSHVGLDKKLPNLSPAETMKVKISTSIFFEKCKKVLNDRKSKYLTLIYSCFKWQPR